MVVQSPPAVTVEPPPLEALDAGVIEEARARQRRHRTGAVAVAVAALIVGMLMGSFSGRGGGTAAERGTGTAGHSSLPANASLASVAACFSHSGTINTAPSLALLSTLSVLRRPTTSADALPSTVAKLYVGPESGQVVFVNYIRLVRRMSAALTFYLMPVLAGCDARTSREGLDLFYVLSRGGRVLDTGGGGESTAAEIKKEGMFIAGKFGPNSTGTPLIAGVVPDGVATITVHYPTTTVTAAAVNNVVVASVPHPGGPLQHPPLTVWRAANGHIIKTIGHGL